MTDDGIFPTKLHSKNRVVDEKNRSALAYFPERSIALVHTMKSLWADSSYKQNLLQKHGLGKNLAHMPYLWACVEKPTPPKRLRDAQNKLSELSAKKYTLRLKKGFQAEVLSLPSSSFPFCVKWMINDLPPS
jgi:hypothetical protein